MTKTDLYKRIDTLPLEGRKLFLSKLRQSLSTMGDTGTGSSHKRLVAYVKGHDGFDASKLNNYLGKNLPDFMIPSSIVALDEIPLLPNGKVDRKALLRLRPDTNTSNRPMEEDSVLSETETILRMIWEEVLNFGPIDVHDNFFEIGGDSILSIQIIAKARAADILLKPNQIFEYQTIAELAMFAFEDTADVVREEITEGELPLTPIQHWFFDIHKSAPHYWNQIVEVSGLKRFSVAAIEKVFTQLIGHHDVLRQSFKNSDGTWKATILCQDDISAFQYFNLSEVHDKTARAARILEKLKETQKNLDLSQGGLFMGVYFDCGENRGNRFFMVAHHLVVDMVSWTILQGDFRRGLEQMGNNKKIGLKEKTSSIKKWANELVTLANSRKILKETKFWEPQISSNVPFPTDFVAKEKVHTEDSIKTHQILLDVDSTKILLNDANKAYNTRIEDLLITSLFNTLTDWGKFDELVLGLERHGRTVEADGLDISNTVGWFTSFFPIKLEKAQNQQKGAQLIAIKEKLRAIPNDGIGYGLLKYLSSNGMIGSREFECQVLFNYLGVRSKSSDTSEIAFEYFWEGARDSRSERTNGLEINAFVQDARLNLIWDYTTDLYKDATIIDLAVKFEKNLIALLDHCTTVEGNNYTPSDFPEANISQEDLDNLMNQFE